MGFYTSYSADYSQQDIDALPEGQAPRASNADRWFNLAVLACLSALSVAFDKLA